MINLFKRRNKKEKLIAKVKRYVGFGVKNTQQCQYCKHYAQTFDGDDKSELEKFISKFEDDPKFKKDLGTIFARIGIIEEQGVLDRFFRYESKKNDKVAALPSHFDTGKLRLYCICYNENLLILGNGGKKTTRSYQEDPILNQYVEDMLKINKELWWKIEKGEIHFEGIELAGNLSFYIE